VAEEEAAEEEEPAEEEEAARAEEAPFLACRRRRARPREPVAGAAAGRWRRAAPRLVTLRCAPAAPTRVLQAAA
jgi:hypothetical protein